MGAVTFYLLLPYMGVSAGQIHHVLPMALFLGALVAYRWPMIAGAILGLATAATYFPVFVLPIWISFYRAPLARGSIPDRLSSGGSGLQFLLTVGLSA